MVLHLHNNKLHHHKLNGHSINNNFIDKEKMYRGGLYNINCDKIIIKAIIKYDCKYQFFKCIVLLGNIQNILYFSKIYNRNIQ